MLQNIIFKIFENGPFLYFDDPNDLENEGQGQI